MAPITNRNVTNSDLFILGNYLQKVHLSIGDEVTPAVQKITFKSTTDVATLYAKKKERKT